MAHHDIPGGAYVITEKNKVITMRSYGVKRQREISIIDNNTLFRIASLSKTFAAELAAITIEEGKLSWQDPVNVHLPHFSFKSQKFTKALKIEHLLSQSSGLSHNAYDNLLSEDTLSIEMITKRFSRINPRCLPGSCYGYQNVLYSLIQPILEKSTGKSYEQLLSERIFRPLNMTHSSVGMKPFVDSKNHASPHIKQNGTWRPIEIKDNFYKVLPAAGVNTSISDLSKWLMAQLGSHPNVISSNIVDKVTHKKIKTKKELYRRSWSKYLNDAHYGIGWRIYQFGDKELVYHGGWVSGFRAAIAYNKQSEIGLAILFNAEAGSISKITSAFWAHLFDYPNDIERKVNFN